MTTLLTAAFGSRRFEVDCTVRVSHRLDDLSAHVELDGDPEIHPGDRVVVHGDAIEPTEGELTVYRRRATVTRATWLGRWWTRLTGDLRCLTLLEVSFTDQRKHQP